MFQEVARMVRSRQHLVTDTSSPVADGQPEGGAGAVMAKITKKIRQK